MGHILKVQPVLKEKIWGGTKLRDVYGYDIPSDHTEKHGLSQVIRVAIAQLLKVNIKEKQYHGCLRIIVNYLVM